MADSVSRRRFWTLRSKLYDKSSLFWTSDSRLLKEEVLLRSSARLTVEPVGSSEATSSNSWQARVALDEAERRSKWYLATVLFSTPLLSWE